ncbi:hypothetical protein ACFDHY_02870 [Staphylococcus hyicus]|uniref:hypothetical protein n=1 Tax=Staphylococcus hyicus TaxID=1284 RepID=UPI0036D42778
MKIKTKKKMNLPELIQWGWDNEAIGRFEGDKGSLVLFDANSWVISNKFVCSEEFFEVEIEEEITEETVIPKLVVVYDDGYAIHTTTFQDTSIDTALNGETVENGERIAFYTLNEDMTMTLLWRNGEMVG